jgi:hypothetical protein
MGILVAGIRQEPLGEGPRASRMKLVVAERLMPTTMRHKTKLQPAIGADEAFVVLEPNEGGLEKLPGARGITIPVAVLQHETRGSLPQGVTHFLVIN